MAHPFINEVRLLETTPGALREDRSPPKTPTHHIFFIPGNPGLISFYETFLNGLHHALNEGTQSRVGYSVSIFGQSLGGFRLPRDWDALGLQKQIEHVEKVFLRHAKDLSNLAEDANGNVGSRPKIILMGHSVGAFIALELMRRQNERLEHARETSLSPFQGPLSKLARGEPSRIVQRRGVYWLDIGHNGYGGGNRSVRVHWRNGAFHPYIPLKVSVVEPDIVGAVMLFPTVMEIAKSFNGRILGLLLIVPDLLWPAVVCFFCYHVRLIPDMILAWIVAMIMNLKTRSNVVRDVVAFLNSKGLRTCLTMARDEWRTITVDKWDQKIWGSATATDDSDTATAGSETATAGSTTSSPKLVFLFGKRDRWVANSTRDRLIVARGATPNESWKPKMEVEKTGVPHGFCIHHNSQVISKVAPYINEIIAGAGSTVG